MKQKLCSLKKNKYNKQILSQTNQRKGRPKLIKLERKGKP